MYSKTELCQVMPFGCFGCCGFKYSNKEEVLEGIKKNTQDFKDFDNLEKFRDRTDKNKLRKCGICYNLIQKKDRFLCPLHPKQHGGDDLRKDHCDIHNLCKAAFAFNKWRPKDKRAFIKFIKDKNYDWYDFSVGLETGEILSEFLNPFSSKK